MIPSSRLLLARAGLATILVFVAANAGAATSSPSPFDAFLRKRAARSPATMVAPPASAPAQASGYPRYNPALGVADPAHRVPMPPGQFFPGDVTSATANAVQPPATINGLSLQFNNINLASAGDYEGNGATDWLRGEPFSSSGSFVGNGHVILYRRSPTGITEVRLDGPSSFANYGAAVACAGDVDNDGYDDFIVGAPSRDGQRGAAYLYRGRAAGFSSVPSWTLTGTQTQGFLGYAVAGAGDVNADGYSDVLVSVPGLNGAAFESGTVYCFHGSSAGLASTPAWTMDGAVSTELNGLAVAGNGDVNADGYSDVLVGGPGWDNGQAEEGRVRLFLGGPGGLSLTAAWSYEPDAAFWSAGKALALPGDMNGDGYGEVVIGMPDADAITTDDGHLKVFAGSPFLFALSPILEFSGGPPSMGFGFIVAACGDLNGDGFADLGATAPHYDSNSGFLFTLYGSSNLGATALYQIDTGPIGSYAGMAMAGGGDPGDGRTDLLIGYGQLPPPAPGEPVVYASQAGIGPPSMEATNGITLDVLGIASTRTFAQGSFEETQYGHSIALADVNGDGYSDVIAGGPTWSGSLNETGHVQAYYGRPEGFYDLPFTKRGTPGAAPAGFPPFTAPDWTYEGQLESGQVGWSVANAGDTDGDGYDDVIVGAPTTPFTDAAEGAAYLFRGGPDGLQSQPSWQTRGHGVFQLYGYGVAGAGDVNQDGYADVLVGSPTASMAPFTSNGTVSLFYGSALGLATLPARVFSGSMDNAYMGTGPAGVGDVDGDGYPDIALQEQNFQGGGKGALPGRLHLHRGGAAGVEAAPFYSFGGSSTYGVPGYWLAAGGDVNGDGYADVLASGLRAAKFPSTENVVFVLHGSPTGPSSVPSSEIVLDDAFDEAGYALSTAGDLDKDGFGDILIGSPGYDPPPPLVDSAPSLDGPIVHEGRVYVHSGSASGVELSPRITFVAQGLGMVGAFGRDVAGGGDTNGDGWPDLLFSAPFAEAGKLSDTGVLGVAYSNIVSDGLDRPFRMLRSDNYTPIAQGLRSDLPTSFRVSALARTPVGRGRVRLQWQTKPWGSPLDATGIGSSGYLRTTVPDVDDGSSIPLNGVVTGLVSGGRYGLRVRNATRHPNFQRSRWFSPHANGPLEFDLRTAGPTGAVAVGDLPLASGVSFAGATPNPIGGRHGLGTTLRFSLPAKGRVTIDAYDAGGRRVGRLLDAEGAAGPGTATWDGRDDAGRALPRGLYFLRLRFAGEERTGKVVIAG